MLEDSRTAIRIRLGRRAEKIVLILQDIDKLRDLADGKWHAGVLAEAA